LTASLRRHSAAVNIWAPEAVYMFPAKYDAESGYSVGFSIKKRCITLC